MKKTDAEKFVEEVAALSVWRCDGYEYGPCADSVQGELDRAADSVLTLLCRRLGLRLSEDKTAFDSWVVLAAELRYGRALGPMEEAEEDEIADAMDVEWKRMDVLQRFRTRAWARTHFREWQGPRS